MQSLSRKCSSGLAENDTYLSVFHLPFFTFTFSTFVQSDIQLQLYLSEVKVKQQYTADGTVRSALQSAPIVV